MKIEEIIDVAERHDFIFALCTLLDEFKRNTNKYGLISNEPPERGLNKEQYCILASVAHKLANDNDIVVPNWVYNEKYVMPTPTYAFNTKNKEYQEYLRDASPIEFKQRNIYCGEDAIMRV